MAKQGQKSASKAKAETKAQSGNIDPAIVILDETREAVKAGERSYVIIAENCFKIREGELYRKLGKGYENLTQYFTEELGISKSKGYYFKDIGQMMHAYKIKREDALEIGWSKMRELSKVINPDNMTDLVQKAKSMNIDNLQEEVKRIRLRSGSGAGGAVAGQPEEYMRYSFKLLDSEYKLVQSAIDTAYGELKEEGATDRKGFLLSHICDQWLSDPAHYDVGPLEARIRHLEERYDVKLMLVPKDEVGEDDEREIDEYQGGDDGPTSGEDFGMEDAAGLDADSQKEIEDILNVAGRTNPDYRLEMI